jgi:hypothetical protein
MQKKLFLNLMLSAVLIVFLWGCAGLQPAFNPKYFSSSAPEAPNSRIELTKEVIDTISTASFQLQTANASIHWVANDNLLLEVGVYGTDGYYAAYLINPSSGKIKRLQGTEEKRILQTIDERIEIRSTETMFTKVIGAIKYYLLYKGKKTPYVGRVKDGNQAVDVALKVDTKGYKKCKIRGKIKNKTNNISIPVKWKSKKHAYDHVNSLEGLFRDFKISPDGRYYIMGAAYVGGPYVYDSYMKRKCKPDWLMRHYRHDAITVDPAWKHIALLRSENSFMQKDNRYWIEIHDFSIAGM